MHFLLTMTLFWNKLLLIYKKNYWSLYVNFLMASLQNSLMIFSWFSPGMFLWCKDCPVCEEGTVGFPPLPSPIIWYQLIYRPRVTQATFWPKGQSSANWFSNAQILWPHHASPTCQLITCPKATLTSTCRKQWLLTGGSFISILGSGLLRMCELVFSW